MMIGELLGYPPEMWERVRFWSEEVMTLAGQTSPEGPPHLSHPGLVPVMQEWAQVTLALIEERRSESTRRLDLAVGPYRGVGEQAGPRGDGPTPRRGRRDDTDRDRFHDP